MVSYWAVLLIFPLSAEQNLPKSLLLFQQQAHFLPTWVHKTFLDINRGEIPLYMLLSWRENPLEIYTSPVISFRLANLQQQQQSAVLHLLYGDCKIQYPLGEDIHFLPSFSELYSEFFNLHGGRPLQSEYNPHWEGQRYLPANYRRVLHDLHASEIVKHNINLIIIYDILYIS